MGARLGKHAGGGRRVAVEERYCKPSGTFTNLRNIDGNRLRQLIQHGKLSPCYPGVEDPAPGDASMEECPICFLVRAARRRPCCGREASGRRLTTKSCAGIGCLARARRARGPSSPLTLPRRRHAQHYPALNRSKCCQKGLCTGALPLDVVSTHGRAAATRRATRACAPPARRQHALPAARAPAA